MSLSYSTLKDDDKIAAELAANHRKFPSFGWSARPDDDENWTVIYTNNRDADLLTQSNAAAIDKTLLPYLESDQADNLIHSERHSHWACGWVDGYAIRVYNPDHTLTDVFRAYCDLLHKMDDYPVLDEEDFSNREEKAAIEAIDRYEIRDHVRKNARDGWQYKVYSWLWDHNQREIDNIDGTGAYPSEESIIAALKDLHLHGTGWNK